MHDSAGRWQGRAVVEKVTEALALGPTMFGEMVGCSAIMRTTFALLQRAAASDSTVLLQGETGTGKEVAAHGIHDASARGGKAFVVVDCAAIPAELMESELFGHERGSFTGATERRVGAFEEASGGTFFLDEIGELPLGVQAKLLHALERRQIRRIGSNRQIPIDVRVIAATNRDLYTEVGGGRFRSDVYFRLAVIKVLLPPLRDLPEDVGPLVARFLLALGATAECTAALGNPENIARLARGAWPGNARELRNHIEASIACGGSLPIIERAEIIAAPLCPGDLTLPEARRRALDDFERTYVATLMLRHGGKVDIVARAAGVHRSYIYRILQRHD
jgi:two-component system response regulator GlrR